MLLRNLFSVLTCRRSQLYHVRQGARGVGADRRRHRFVWRGLCEDQRQAAGQAVWHQELSGAHLLQGEATNHLRRSLSTSLLTGLLHSVFNIRSQSLFPNRIIMFRAFLKLGQNLARARILIWPSQAWSHVRKFLN